MGQGKYARHLSYHRIVAEVTDLGSSRDYSTDDGRVATNKIRIDRIIPTEEWTKRDNTSTQVEYRAGKLFSVRRVEKTIDGLLFNSVNDEAAVTIHVGADLAPVQYENVVFQFTKPGTYQYWYNFGFRHRAGDKPAIICPGMQQYWQDNKLHREGDKPAFIDETMGERKWYKGGNLHREVDEPAWIRADGSMEYHKYGKLHRHMLPAIVDKNCRPIGYYANGVKVSAEWFVSEWKTELKLMDDKLSRDINQKVFFTESKINDRVSEVERSVGSLKTDVTQKSCRKINCGLGIATTALIGSVFALALAGRNK